ncbi:hypothetical protein [Chromobacterium phragmitis]|uniref:hypothetical protein n=1 Tax=Chromobacterium phragmitis TaxID=2202141 RepID=UPI0011AE2517|nr:hypothetical protein [Chromobacterium phragmitis]
MLNAISQQPIPITASSPSEAAKPAKPTDISNPSSVETQISPLARLLGDSMSLMKQRESTLSRGEMAGIANSALNTICGPGYDTLKSLHYQQKPSDPDPARQKLAADANAFLEADGKNSQHALNPFAGLSREELDAVASDDSGRYTVNERRAAYLEAYDKEQAWRRQVMAAGQAEREATGSRRHFYEEILNHYQALPPLEQSLYPASYSQKLQAHIQREPAVEDDSFDWYQKFPLADNNKTPT